MSSKKITVAVSDNGKVLWVVGPKGTPRIEMKKARQAALGKKGPFGISDAQMRKYVRDSKGRFART